jgi:cytochrome P450/NADPH-cytochrome P450 reductase
LFYELMANPPAYLKLQAEIDKVVGQGPITVEHMGKLPYVEACLRETLRLHPTAPAFSLTAKGDQVLGGEYQIRDQQVVTIFLSGLHRDKAVYGEDAEDFRPDRMLDEAFKKLPSDSWKVSVVLTAYVAFHS